MEKNVIERALLCSLFLDQVAILEVVGLLRPEMFSDPDHGFIYEAFTDLFNRNKRPDLILVEGNEKERSGALREDGRHGVLVGWNGDGSPGT